MLNICSSAELIKIISMLEETTITPSFRIDKIFSYNFSFFNESALYYKFVKVCLFSKVLYATY